MVAAQATRVEEWQMCVGLVQLDPIMCGYLGIPTDLWFPVMYDAADLGRVAKLTGMIQRLSVWDCASFAILFCL